MGLILHGDFRGYFRGVQETLADFLLLFQVPGQKLEGILPIRGRRNDSVVLSSSETENVCRRWRHPGCPGQGESPRGMDGVPGEACPGQNWNRTEFSWQAVWTPLKELDSLEAQGWWKEGIEEKVVLWEISSIWESTSAELDCLA